MSAHLAIRAELIAELMDAGATDFAERVRDLPTLDRSGARNAWRIAVHADGGIVATARMMRALNLPAARMSAWGRAEALATLVCPVEEPAREMKRAA